MGVKYRKVKTWTVKNDRPRYQTGFEEKVKLKNTLLVLAGLFLVSCSLSISSPTPIPSPTFTQIPTITSQPTATPNPTATLVLTPTPNPLTGIIPKELPTGEPITIWRDIPIMPGAIHGDTFNSSYIYGGGERYSFTIQATPDEILNYYESALTEIGAHPERAILQGTNVQMIMGKLETQYILIWIIPYQDFVLVILTQDVPNI